MLRWMVLMITENKSPAHRQDHSAAWAKNLPVHWQIRRLRSVIEMRVSNVDKHTKDDEIPVRLCNYVDVYYNDRINAELPYMKATASPEESERFRLQRGDVVITKDSEAWDDIAIPALVTDPPDDLICGYHLAILRPSQAMEGPYLARVIQARQIGCQFHMRAQGITRYGLTHDDILSASVPLPPLEEQAAIVRYLDHADELINRYISTKERLIALLEEQRQAAIHLALTRGLDPLVKFRPSGQHWLGNIPEHWEVCRAKRLFSPRRESARQDDIQLSATQAYGVIPQDEYERRQGRRIVKISLHLDKRQHVEVDDFVISMRSFQGGLERAWSSGCIRSSYVILRPGPEVDVGWFSYLFKSHAYIQALQSTANFIRDGQDLNFNNFCAVDLPLPPLAEQRKAAIALGKATSNIDTNIVRARRQINLMIEYRTRLIADAVTGQLDMSKAAVKLPD